MKVIDIYDKNDNIESYNKDVFKTMNDFLLKYPEEYRKNYYHNLETLRLFKVDTLPDGVMTGMYNSKANVVFYSNNNALGHEFFHIASNDLINKKYSIESDIGIEYGLIEGITEYLNVKAYGLSKPDSYGFHVFCVMMMENIKDFFKPYFMANHNEFIKLFPNPKDVYSLMYSLNVYSDNIYDYLSSIYNDEDNSLVDISTIKDAVNSTIDNLISIELSIDGSDKYRLNKYADKFMDLIGSKYLKSNFDDVYHDYIKYAENQIKKRIRSR